ncbi:hypothetical protein ABGB17_35615 [Sphaerisporangium sp. B11E5]|uniref:hypothetical protein n=1 Tax=Sphaerisporangium sp. B11E5 TaxID=3153563 RepID=UPI00325F760D
MALLFILLLLLTLCWPLIAVAGPALAALAGYLYFRASAKRGAVWAVMAAAGAIAVATYGYGLAGTTFGAVTDPGDRCHVARHDLYSPGHQGPAGGVQTMWPLHDTTCGPDLVPGFVNPLVTGATGLFVVLLLIMTVAGVRSRRGSRRS